MAVGYRASLAEPGAAVSAAMMDVPASWSDVDLLGVSAEGYLTEPELEYLRDARSENTRRGYVTDLRQWVQWCDDNHVEALPARPADVRAHLVALAQAGATTGTIGRRLSTLRTLHKLRGWPDPGADPSVSEVWRGIRNRHGRPPLQAKPLMPPLLWDVLAACPTTRPWAKASRPVEENLAGARDRALLLVGFVGALRRSELAALRVVDVVDHENGLVVKIHRSKTNQTGEHAELVVLPRATRQERCPVRAVTTWLDLAGIERTDEGPLLRPVSKGNRALARPLSPGGLNVLVQKAIERAGTSAQGYSAHSLRAGFVTWADLADVPVRAIMHQTRHRSAASVAGYVRINDAWRQNAATMIRL